MKVVRHFIVGSNGLPQSYVLSPILFNVYTSDIVNTGLKKFIYADDIMLDAQTKNFTVVIDILNQDLIKLHNYFIKCHLTLNPTKTVGIAFHLKNRETPENYK